MQCDVYLYVPLLHLKQNTYVKNFLLLVKVSNIVLTMKVLQVLYFFVQRKE